MSSISHSLIRFSCVFSFQGEDIMRDQREFPSEEELLNNFFQSVAIANDLVANFNQITSSTNRAVNRWKDVTEIQKKLEQALQEVGWQTIKLYQAGLLDEEEECSENEELIFENHQEKEEVQAFEIIEEAESEEELPRELATEEYILALNHILNGAKDESDLEKESVEEEAETEIDFLEAWKTSAIFLTGDSNYQDRSECFNQINKVFSCGYFELWKEEASEVSPDILRFFIATILYIQHVPRKLRPNNALGDGAYYHHLNSISKINSKAKSFVQSFSNLGDEPEQLLEKIQKYWLRVEKKIISQPKKKTQPAAEFNLEIAIQKLQELLLNDDTPKTIRHLQRMVENHMSLDPRLIKIAAEYPQLLKDSCFKQLRSKIKNYRKTLRTVEEVSSEEAAESWEFAEEFAGKCVLIIGGDKGRILKNQCQSLLPEADIVWVQTSPKEGYNRLKSTVTSIKRGKYDYVLVIQNFVNHAVSNAIFKGIKKSTYSVKGSLVTGGYGRNSIKEGLKRCL